MGGVNTAFYGPRMEGATRSDLAQVIDSRDNPLFGVPGGFNGSAAPSPYDLYPGMYSRWVDVYDRYGKLWQHVLVGDKSYVRTGVPNRNTIEFYNALRRDVPTRAVSLRLSPVQRRATREEIEAAGRPVTINYHAPITIHGTGPDLEHRLAAAHRRHIDQMRRDLAEVEYMNKQSSLRSGQSYLNTFDDAEVALCARAECLTSLFVSLAFVGGQRSFVTVKFDNDRSLLQACFVRIHFTRPHRQKPCAKRLKCRHR